MSWFIVYGTKKTTVGDPTVVFFIHEKYSSALR